MTLERAAQLPLEENWRHGLLVFSHPLGGAPTLSIRKDRLPSGQPALPSFTCCTSESPWNSRNPSLVPSGTPAVPHTDLHSCGCPDPECESRCPGEVHRPTQNDQWGHGHLKAYAQ